MVFDARTGGRPILGRKCLHGCARKFILESHARHHRGPGRRCAGRTGGGRPAAATGLRRVAPLAAQSWRMKRRGRRSRPRPWSTKRICASSAVTRPSRGTVVATSSPPLPRPCAASWSKTPAAAAASNAAAATFATTSTTCNWPRRAGRGPAGPGRRPESARRGRSGQGRAGQAPLLRGHDHRGGGRRPRHFVRHRQALLGLRPRLALPGRCRRSLGIGNFPTRNDPIRSRISHGKGEVPDTR